MTAPGELWRDAFNAMTPKAVAAIARSLGTTDEYALRPFAPYHDGERWWLAAITTPCPFNAPECLAWEPDGDVILIAENMPMRLLGDSGGHFVSPVALPAGEVTLYTVGTRFARDWAQERASWANLCRTTNPDSRCEPTGQPGIALCGDLAGVRDFAPLRAAKCILIDDPRMVKPVTTALLRDARLPRVDSAPPRLRVAA